MKRFLLFAAAAVIAVSANAQLSEKKAFSAKSHRQTQKMNINATKMSKADKVVPAVNFGGKQVTNLDGIDKKLAKKARFVDGKAINGTFVPANTSRRAGSIQAAYDGYGRSNSDNVKWSMTSTSSGALGGTFTNVIPEVENLTNITVNYTKSLVGGTITIKPQYVGTYSGTDKETNEPFTDYVFLFSGSSENGNITMTINDDNTISTSDDILYGAFIENKFTPVTDDSFDEKYDGLIEYLTRISYLVAGQLKAPEVMYEPDGLYLHVNTSPTWYGYQSVSIMHIPADARTNFLNYTQDDTDSWSWTMHKMKTNAAGDGYEPEETMTATTPYFYIDSYFNSVYDQPALVGTYNGASSAPYQWSLHRTKTEGYVMAGGDMTYDFTDGSVAQINKCDPANRVTTAKYLGTPDINSQKYSLSSLIFYQGKPAAPIYFEGISLWVGAFEQRENFNLKCKIQKVTRDENTLKLTLGDVIAEADLDLEDITLDNEDASDIWAQLNWNSFYMADEEGLTEEVDYLQLDDEFAIVFEGWDNGTFTAAPIIEYSGDMVNTASTTSLYVQDTGDDAVLGFMNNYSHPYASFKGAVYGWLHTEDSKDIKLAAEGGQAAIHVEPMFSGQDEEGNPTTRIWLSDASEDIPEWLTIRTANEVYTSDEYGFDLVFEAEALPAGTNGRQANLILEQWGSQLAVTVTQGEASGVNVVVNKINGNTPAYNLAGQRVNNDYKGLIIKDGKKMIRK